MLPLITRADNRRNIDGMERLNLADDVAEINSDFYSTNISFVVIVSHRLPKNKAFENISAKKKTAASSDMDEAARQSVLFKFGTAVIIDVADDLLDLQRLTAGDLQLFQTEHRTVELLDLHRVL